MSARVSIIIPCHNTAPWLAEAIESALAQTWQDREIIVVDDGSRDGSPDLARRYQSQGVTVIAQAHRGAAAARNRGWQDATGDFLQFLDADDLLAPEKISAQLALPARRPHTLLSGCWQRFGRTPGDLPAVVQPLCADFSPVDWVVAKLEQHAMMHPAAWLVPRALAERAGPWDESLSLDDDGEFFVRVVLASAEVRCCPAAVSHYRSALAGSLSGRKSDAAWNSAFRSLQSSVSRLRAAEDSPRTRRAGATALQRFIYDAYPGGRDARGRAAAELRLLGGSKLQPPGGPRFHLLRRFLGWRLARRLQLWSAR